MLVYLGFEFGVVGFFDVVVFDFEGWCDEVVVYCLGCLDDY